MFSCAWQGKAKEAHEPLYGVRFAVEGLEDGGEMRESWVWEMGTMAV